MPVFSITNKTINPRQLRKALSYIDNYWDELKISASRDQQTLIGLPNPYIVPSSEARQGFVYREMYYWDNYFIVEALLASGQRELARGIVDNMLAMIEKFGLVPNANRYYMLSRSQPPLLTSMILAVYAHAGDKRWFKRAMTLAKQEYHMVWMGNQQPHNRQAYKGLSRYYDINVLHELAEAESGWDYSPRFDNRCLDWLPVDLNSYLYKYEMDFSGAGLLPGADQDDSWADLANTRAKRMRRLLWDKKSGLFLDYDYTNRRRAQTSSLASYMPLFSGLAQPQEAESARQALKRFETKWGLSATSLDGGMHVGQQWALPNGWAPLHYLVIKGLQRYSYDDDARRIAEKWLKLNLKTFIKTGRFYEKYNVVKGNHRAVPGVYPAQVGFGWTNAVFMVLAKELYS